MGSISNWFKKNKKVQEYKEKSKKVFIKLLIWIGIFLLLYLGFQLIKPYFFKFLQHHPVLNAIYEHITHQISEKTYLGLFYAATFGALFFITIPFEVLIIYYISLGYNIYLISIVALIGATLGLLANYGFGMMLGKHTLKHIFKDNYDKLKGWVDKYGGVFLFLGNLIPSPIEPATVIYGAARYPIRQFIVYSLLGRMIKIILLYFIVQYFSTTLLPILSHIF